MTGSKAKNVCNALISTGFLTYSTVKLVKVPNTYIAVLNRVIQLIVFAYIALYIVWWKRGYQEFQIPSGISITKVKGLARIQASNSSSHFITDTHQRLWDTAEYEIPPLENNAFFIATHQLVTNDQVEGVCPSTLKDNLLCNTDADCKAGTQTQSRSGYLTGKCVETPEAANTTVCQISAWCPEEGVSSSEYRIDQDDLEDFSVYIKSAVTFTKFGITLRNVRNDTNFTCRYNKTTAPRCPIFYIGDILRDIKTNQTALLSEGGLIEIEQKWECNFDFKPNRCFPKHEFHLLQSGEESQSPGINYRLAQKYRQNQTDYRTLLKIYGLRFIVTTTGRAGRFDIVNLFVAIGSGIGFMVIGGVVCDFIFMYIHRSRERYRRTKISICEAGINSYVNPTAVQLDVTDA